MQTKHVEVCPYDPAWVQDFLAIKSELKAALGDFALQIEHVGSTSVEGLWAKPIIDIDVVVEDVSDLMVVIRSLSANGYTHEGNLGIDGREAFKYQGKQHLRKHHLYVCQKDSAELKRHISFRDYLRMHPKALKEYSEVKRRGARLFLYDIDSYIEYKSSVIGKIYDQIARAELEL